MDGLRRLVRALRASTVAAERAAGVSAAQLFALREIAAHPGQSLRELAERTLTTQSTVSEVVARLVEGGLVARRRDAADRRRAILVATPAGRTMLQRAPETAPERLRAGLARLSLREREQLARSLERWIDAAGLDHLPATMFFENESGRACRR
jgi:DNA-binding MarR family transcriptional regulator